MKSRFLIPLIILSLSLCGCNATIDLTGDNAATRIVEISSDPEESLGKTIRLAGYYTYEDFSGSRYHYVLLSSEEGQNVGFEIRWDGTYPDPGTPVTVTGILKSETVYGQAYIYLQITELHVLHPIS